MKIILFVGTAICAYLISGINPSIILSKTIYGKDIRECGSQNPGFTNFKRTFGGKWAWLVMIIDLSKSAVVTAVFAALFEKCVGSYTFGAAYTGFFALLGHVFPVWYGFRGGKGFLAYMSVVWLIDWRAGLIATIIMLLLLLVTRIMSLSTVCAMLSCPVTLYSLGASAYVVAICAISVLFIAYRHKENFKRLVQGTEKRFSFR